MTGRQNVALALATHELEKIVTIATRNQLHAPSYVQPSLRAIVERAERAIRELRTATAIDTMEGR